MEILLVFAVLAILAGGYVATRRRTPPPWVRLAAGLVLVVIAVTHIGAERGPALIVGAFGVYLVYLAVQAHRAREA